MSSTVEAWRLRSQMYRMVGERCCCGKIIFPPRDICPECGSSDTGSEKIRQGIQNPEVFHQSQEGVERR